MMRCCDKCSEWAQWALLEGTLPTAEQREQDEKEKLHPRGVNWRQVGQFCTPHKETVKLEPNQRLRFAGATPLGA